MLTQKLVPGRRPDVYIPGQAAHAYILKYWYLVPLIKPRWAAGLLIAYQVCRDVGRCVKIELLFVEPGVKSQWTVLV